MNALKIIKALIISVKICIILILKYDWRHLIEYRR